MPRVAREVVEAVVLALIVFLLIQGSVRNFRVDGSSMKPTLEGGQYLLVNKLVYFQLDTGRLSRIIPFWKTNKPTAHFALHPPNRGDVIVFRFPRDPSKEFVKRVIGLPGEVIEQKDGTTFVNGVPLEEPYLKTEHKSVYPATQIGEKEYFVMGDNRRSSNDSRTWGPVPEENLLGKVWVVYWPFNEAHLLDTASAFVRGLFR